MIYSLNDYIWESYMSSKKEIIRRKKGEVIHEAKVSEKGFSHGRQKEKVLMFWIIVFFLIFLLLFLYFNFNKSTVDSTNHNFKKEYERLNGKKDKNGNLYLELVINEDNVIQYANYKKIFSILERGTAVVYFGASDCPGCRALVPILLEAADETGIDTIYYLNLTLDRDQKNLDSKGRINIEKKGEKEYQELLLKLDSILGSYTGLDDNTIKRIYFPTVVFIRDGDIISSYIGDMNSEENSTYQFTTKEQQELKDNFINSMNQLISCNDAC